MRSTLTLALGLLTVSLPGCVPEAKMQPQVATRIHPETPTLFHAAPPVAFKTVPGKKLKVAPKVAPEIALKVGPGKATTTAKKVIDCRKALKLAKARFKRWRAPNRRIRGTKIRCIVPNAVVLYRGPTGLRFGAPKVNCAFALRLLRFEKVLQQEARRAFGQPVARILMWASYQCRGIGGSVGMASEHSFGNAVDIGGVVLRSGRWTTVKRHYLRRGRLRKATRYSRFWERLSKRLYREKIFSVVLTPNFDSVHHNHLHLDAAPYTMDGT